MFRTNQTLARSSVSFTAQLAVATWLSWAVLPAAQAEGSTISISTKTECVIDGVATSDSFVFSGNTTFLADTAECGGAFRYARAEVVATDFLVFAEASANASPAPALGDRVRASAVVGWSNRFVVTGGTGLVSVFRTLPSILGCTWSLDASPIMGCEAGPGSFGVQFGVPFDVSVLLLLSLSPSAGLSGGTLYFGLSVREPSAALEVVRAVPEPSSTLLLCGLALAAFGCLVRWRSPL